MAQISRSTKVSGGTTLASNTSARAVDVETDILTMFNAHNNHDTGTSKWTVVSAEGATSVPLLANNSTGTQNILEARDNGTAVLTVADGGATTILATGGSSVPLVVNNGTSTGNIIEIKDNGTNRLTIADGGNVTLNGGTIAMGSAKITGLAAGSTSGDAVRYEQLPSVAGTITNWAALASMTVTGFGSIANSTFLSRRVGDSIQVRGNFTVGTATGVSATINLPTITVDTAKLATNINSPVGFWYNLTSGAQTFYSTGGAGVLYFKQTDNTKIYCSVGSTGNSFVESLGNAIVVNSTNFAFYFEVPITGYSI
jgi:hypothetical protein